MIHPKAEDLSLLLNSNADMSSFDCRIYLPNPSYEFKSIHPRHPYIRENKREIVELNLKCSNASIGLVKA